MDKKLRVLAVCYEDPEVLLGGRGTHVKELYRAMAEVHPEIEVDLLTVGPTEGVSMYYGYKKHHADKLICWKPRSPNMTSILATDIQMLRTVTQLMAKGYRWDVVHAHDWEAVQVARCVRDAFNIPFIGHVHLSGTHLWSSGDTLGTQNDDEDTPLSQEFLYIMQQEGHLVVDSDIAVTCSHAYARVLGQLFLTKRPIETVHNGIRTDEWTPGVGDAIRALEQHKLPPRPIALYVGRIAEMKGIVEILKAVELRDTGWCIVLVGEINADSDAAKEGWVVTKELRRLEKLYPERLRWVGFREGQELFDLYAAADAGLMPSVHEPFGIVALEHMAMGVPLIASEREGLREIVTDDLGNEYALIIQPTPENINKALDVVKDTNVQNELIGLGLVRARHFSWAAAASRMVGLYQTATSRRQVA